MGSYETRSDVSNRPRRFDALGTGCYVARRVVTADSLPHDALERAVRAAFGAAARLVETRPLAGDASSRRYVRCVLRSAPHPTVVAMLLGEGRFAPGSDELGGGGETELPFVNVGRWCARVGLPVPAVYHDASTTDGLLLLEDVGDTTLWAAASAAPERAPALFGDAVDLLVRFHVAGARHPAPDCYAFRRRFDRALAHAELEHFVDHGIETRHGRPLPPAERARILDALGPIETVFVDTPPLVGHRDFMAWNLHVQDGALRLIDFQDALLSPDAYDLAALLTDRHTPTLVDPALEAALVARYVAGRGAAGVPVAGDLSARYGLCALHRALKVIGRFHQLELVRGRPGYLAYLPGVYAVARRMFDRHPELAAARALVAPLVPELA